MEDTDSTEDEVERNIERLNILIIHEKVETLNKLGFLDYHKMLDLLKDEDEPCCDFGIFVVNDTDLCENIKTGDVIISIEDEDLLESTAAQLKTILNKHINEQIVTITIGRK